jgi:hypothetical protein
MARVTGLEPATSGVTGRRSNQLSYTRSKRCGIEEPPRAVNRQEDLPAICCGTSERENSTLSFPSEIRISERISRCMVGGERLELPALSV